MRTQKISNNISRAPVSNPTQRIDYQQRAQAQSIRQNNIPRPGSGTPSGYAINPPTPRIEYQHPAFSFTGRPSSPVDWSSYQPTSGIGSIPRRDPSIGNGLSGSLQDILSRPYMSRMAYMEGGPVDTYPNVEDPKAVEAAQAPDAQVEREYFGHVVGSVLNPKEVSYLADTLQSDPNLQTIIEKLIVSASEFSGEGPVEGPGSGTSDSIPARLSDGEFVMTEKATKQIGPENLQYMMDEAEKAYDGGLMTKTPTQQGLKEDIDRMMLASSKLNSQ